MQDELAAKHARVVGEVFQEVADESRHVRAHFRVAPQKGSESLLELSRADSEVTEARMLVELAHSTGNTFLIPAEQAARSIGSLMQTPDAQFPSVIITRSLLEWSARGGWVYEPGIGWRLRVERGLTEYLRSLFEQGEIARVVEAKEHRQRVRGRVKRYVDAAQGCEFKVIPPAGNLRHSSIGSTCPSTAALISKLLPTIGDRLSKAVWKLPSAMTHGTTFAILQLFDHGPVVLDGRPGAELQDNPQFVTELARLGLLGYLEFFGRVMQVFKWDPDHWTNKRARWAKRLNEADPNRRKT